jgi:hypothetical protein
MAGDRVRITDLPLLALDVTARPNFLKDRVLSASRGFVPSMYGGYKNTPAWALHGAIPSGHSIIGISRAGPIIPGGTVQITVTTKGPGAFAYPFQFRVLADASWNLWGGLGGTWGTNQDVTRDRVVYLRRGSRELVLGWDLDIGDTYGYGCALYESCAGLGGGVYDGVTFLGVEPFTQSGVTLTASATGGAMGAGYVRVYFVYWGSTGQSDSPIYPDATSQTGFIDHDNIDGRAAAYMDVRLTGVSGTNRISVAAIPPGTYYGSTHVQIYRTRVVANQHQLPDEAAYFCARQLAITPTCDIVNSDAFLVTCQKLQKGRYAFPGAKKHNKFVGNLHLVEHKDKLFVSGVDKDYRVWMSGYVDTDLVPQEDETSWAFSADLPNRDKVITMLSGFNKMFALGQNGFYVLHDSPEWPSGWTWKQMASMRGEHISAMALIGSDVFLIGRAAGGEWNIWGCDGYNLKPVGDSIRATLDSNTGVIGLDGQAVLIGGTSSRKYVANHDNVWGHRNVPDLTAWSIGRDSTIQSGAPLLATAAGIYYEGTAMVADDYVISREFVRKPEERTEWEKVFVYVRKLSTSTAYVDIFASIDGGTFVQLGGANAVSSTEETVIALGVPASVRQGKRFRVKVQVTSQQVIVEGIGVQARAVPEEL